MTRFFTFQRALAIATNTDPVLCLAHATSWLDPLWRDDEDDWTMPQDEEGMLYIALRALRRAFPDIYFDALLAIRRGATYRRLDHLICDAVQKQGIPLEGIEWVGFGIPMPAYGAVLDDPDFYTSYPETLPVLACFGIDNVTSPEPDSRHIVVPDRAYRAADILAADLMKQDDEHWRQVAWLLRFLFSQTGNSSVDWDLEMMSSVQPLEWEAADIAFAREIIEEADGIMQDVATALDWISQRPALLETLRRNIHQIYQKKGKQNARYRFEWPRVARGDERRTSDVA